jgi:hypothetical protein
MLIIHCLQHPLPDCLPLSNIEWLAENVCYPVADVNSTGNTRLAETRPNSIHMSCPTSSRRMRLPPQAQHSDGS